MLKIITPALTAAVLLLPAAALPDDLTQMIQQDLQSLGYATGVASGEKRGFQSLMRAVSRTATQFGNDEVAQITSEAIYDLYNANQTAEDLKSAAKDLGIKKKDIEACRSPSASGEQS